MPLEPSGCSSATAEAPQRGFGAFRGRGDPTAGNIGAAPAPARPSSVFVILLIGVGSRRRPASQAIDIPNDGGVNFGRLFTDQPHMRRPLRISSVPAAGGGDPKKRPPAFAGALNE
jgi:hypothetical protein